MYDKMFKATGGARMGMRARASQNGKLARTEGGQDGAGGVCNADDNATEDAVKDEPRAARRSPFGATDEALEGPTSRKRRRAVGADAGREGKEQSSVAAAEGVTVKKEKSLRAEVKKEKTSGVEVKKEKKSGDKKVAGVREEGVGDGGAEVEATSKAERRRQRSEAKKAKRANQAVKEEGSEEGAADSDSETQALVPVPARGEGGGKGKARKKKKKRAAKEV